MFLIALQLLAALLLSQPSHIYSSIEFRHHDNDEIIKELEKVHEECPNITRIYTLSENSVNGKPLYVIEFSTKPGHHELRKFLDNFTIHIYCVIFIYLLKYLNYS